MNARRETFEFKVWNGEIPDTEIPATLQPFLSASFSIFFSSRSCTRVFDRITAHVSLVSNQGWIKRSSLFLSLRFVFIPILQFSSFAIRTRIFEHAVANPRISFLKLKFPFSRTVKICSWYESSNHHRMEKRRLLLKKYRISRYRACARWIRRLFNKSCRHGSARNFARLNSAR